jgi:membrane peptidoglycan carboxypeptidase
MTSYYDDEPIAPQRRGRASTDGYGSGAAYEEPASYDAAGHEAGPSFDSPGYDPFAPAGHGNYDAGYDNYDAGHNSPPVPATAPIGRATASASVPTGSASVPTGSASVPTAPASVPTGSGFVPTGSAAIPTGRASVGRATVRPAAGYDDGFDPFADEFAVTTGGRASTTTSGRASVPTAAGRATVGRVTVTPVRPDVDAPFDPFDPNDPDAPAGPGGPGGPRRPGVPAGKGKGPVSKKSKRRRRIVAALACLIMLIGVGVVLVTYYAATIPAPTALPLPQSTTIYYSDGSVMARIGDEQRQIVSDDQITPVVRQAVIATEDTTFYGNSGVDFKGIARAFVNNITGGSTEGASTITQQYAREIAKLDKSVSYTRKAKEIVMAIKLTNKMKKDDILDAYLNTVYFGRGAYGIQAAAQAFFHKNAKDLKANEAMVLAGQIKDPSTGVYDPECGTPKKTGPPQPPCPAALQRFQYTQTQMKNVSHPGFLDAAQVQALTYPTTWVRQDTSTIDRAMASPEGFIVHHVMSELTQPDSSGHVAFTATDDLKNGGYQIYTTIDHTAQMAADHIAGGIAKDSPAYQLVKGTGAALVAVQPGTGNVIAYYGGRSGANLDYGGIYNDPVLADGNWTGAHAVPGSSFKTVTLATALQAGVSIDSYWYGPNKVAFADRGTDHPVSNAGTEACPGATKVCTLWKALQLSLNTVYYAVGQYQNKALNIKITPAKVVNMAASLGIKNIWSRDRCGANTRQQLTGTNGDQIWPKCIDSDVAFGAYAVALQDVSNAMATIANHGVRMDEHFVDRVYQTEGDTKTLRYKSSQSVKAVQVPGMTPQMFNDETWAMQQVFTNHDEQDNQLAGGRQAAVKTGTFQLGDDPKTVNLNSSAYFNGFTAGTAKQGAIAASVWVGYTGNAVAVKTKNGANVGGASVPAKIWQEFVDAYQANGPGGHPYPLVRFDDEGSRTGNPDAGPMASPTPSITAPPSAPTGPTPGSAIPTAPSGLSVTNTTTNAVSLSWGASSDDRGVVGYDVYRGSAKIGSVAGTSYLDNGLSPGTNYNYTVVAFDADGNHSPPSNTVTATTQGGGGDTQPPSTPGNLAYTIQPVSALNVHVALTWNASTDNVGVAGYLIFRDGTQIGTSSGPSYVDRNAKKGTTYNYRVVAVDAAHNQSSPSDALHVVT